jgi:hypothetical protein
MQTSYEETVAELSRQLLEVRKHQNNIRDNWDNPSVRWHQEFEERTLGRVRMLKQRLLELGVPKHEVDSYLVDSPYGAGAEQVGSGGFGLSNEPFERAIERIQALIDREQDPIDGTLRRIAATQDPDKLLGIYQAAKLMVQINKRNAIKNQWKYVARIAARKRNG